MNVSLKTYIGKEEQGKYFVNIRSVEDLEQSMQDIEEFLRNELYEAEENAL